MMIKPVVLTRTTVTASAVAHLRSEIIADNLSAGEGLPEAKIGELLGISRAPIREALAVLEREGLVTFDRRGTARVCTFGLEEVREIGMMRLTLEPVAARLASERRPSDELLAIETNLRRLKQSTSLPVVTQLDLDFHRLILQASGNHRLQSAWENLASQFLLVMARFHRNEEKKTLRVRDSTHRAHCELFTPIWEGNSAQAESIARKHATEWLDELQQSGLFPS
ncbi:MAG: GntR family transcriptional regulator [Planctomycetia bacterium]|nr:GntR family transcriptional regulator [Planctomycetia bacterium]